VAQLEKKNGKENSLINGEKFTQNHYSPASPTNFEKKKDTDTKLDTS
jgi:hypothetical protein